MRFHVDTSVKPYSASTPATIPIFWEAQVEADLKRDVMLGVIEECPLNELQDWCAHMHVVAKANGEPRRVVNFSSLNTTCWRQTHHTPAPFTQAQQVPAGSSRHVHDSLRCLKRGLMSRDNHNILSLRYYLDLIQSEPIRNEQNSASTGVCVCVCTVSNLSASKYYSTPPRRAAPHRPVPRRLAPRRRK